MVGLYAVVRVSPPPLLQWTVSFSLFLPEGQFIYPVRRTSVSVYTIPSVRWQSFHWRDTARAHRTTRKRNRLSTIESGVSKIRGKITGHENSVCRGLKNSAATGCPVFCTVS